MFVIVINERPLFGEPGDRYEVEFGNDFDAASEALVEWADWMDRGVDSVLALNNPKGEGWNMRPVLIAEIALTYRRDT